MTAVSSEAPVLVRRDGGLGRVTLNRPRVLNALSFPMVEIIAAALEEWERDADVVAIVIDGAGPRGLCAGGDIRAVREAMLTGRTDVAIDFMAREYRLNARIATYPKPYIALMHGLTMGGGIGLSAHGHIRLMTPDTLVAMPETAIGLFPDVGGTFLLSRAPGELGTHAALTARRFGPADAMVLGVADQMVAADRVPALLAALAGCRTPDAVKAAVTPFAERPPDGVLARQRAWIDRCYRHDSVEAILAALDRDAEPDARDAGREIRRNSPTGLKITLRGLREASVTPTLEACLERELRMMSAALHSRELSEGIRAAVIDKDGAPRWQPARLEDVDAAMVETYFAPCAPALWPA